jgi:hypothetical protein
VQLCSELKNSIHSSPRIFVILKANFPWNQCLAAEGFGCNNNGNGNNVRDLDMNQPASGGEEEFPMGSVEEVEDERGGAGGPHRSKKLRLSKEQSRLLEESFRLNHTLTPVSRQPHHC